MLCLFGPDQSGKVSACGAQFYHWDDAVATAYLVPWEKGHLYLAFFFPPETVQCTSKKNWQAVTLLSFWGWKGSMWLQTESCPCRESTRPPRTFPSSRTLIPKCLQLYVERLHWECVLDATCLRTRISRIDWVNSWRIEDIQCFKIRPPAEPQQHIPPSAAWFMMELPREDNPRDMVVSINGGTPSYHPFQWDFPLQTIHWGYPHLWKSQYNQQPHTCWTLLTPKLFKVGKDPLDFLTPTPKRGASFKNTMMVVWNRWMQRCRALPLGISGGWVVEPAVARCTGHKSEQASLYRIEDRTPSTNRKYVENQQYC